jgi:hypothetical protein
VVSQYAVYVKYVEYVEIPFCDIFCIFAVYGENMTVWCLSRLTLLVCLIIFEGSCDGYVSHTSAPAVSVGWTTGG